MVQRLPILFAVCLGIVLSAAPEPVRAHSGRVALAFPLEQITVDGELSDWPADLPRYPILLPEYGDYPHGPADYEGYFRVGYNLSEQVLYLAVEVRDESAVIGPVGLMGWTDEDGSDLYVHRQHSDMKAPVVQYTLLGEVVKYGNTHFAQAQAWRQGDRHCYEWLLDMAGIMGSDTPLQAGMTVGLDAVVYDKDEDGSYSWVAWSKGTHKYEDYRRLGDVVLVPAGTPVGALQIQLQWADTGGSAASIKVRIAALDAPDRWVHVETDSLGRAEAVLPIGRYQLQADIRHLEQESRVVDLGMEGREAVLSVTPSTGTTVAAGSGRLVPARSGVRMGAWQNFGVTDGLPHPQIRALLQDRRGGWLEPL